MCLSSSYPSEPADVPTGGGDGHRLAQILRFAEHWASCSGRCGGGRPIALAGRVPVAAQRSLMALDLASAQEEADRELWSPELWSPEPQTEGSTSRPGAHTSSRHPSSPSPPAVPTWPGCSAAAAPGGRPLGSRARMAGAEHACSLRWPREGTSPVPFQAHIQH